MLNGLPLQWPDDIQSYGRRDQTAQIAKQEKSYCLFNGESEQPGYGAKDRTEVAWLLLLAALAMLRSCGRMSLSSVFLFLGPRGCLVRPRYYWG